MAVLSHVLDKGVKLGADGLNIAVRGAVCHGHLPVLQLLWERGHEINGRFAERTALACGQMEVVSWLKEVGIVAAPPPAPAENDEEEEDEAEQQQQEEAVPEPPDWRSREAVVAYLARGGSLCEEALVRAASEGRLADAKWLRGLGCAWGPDVFTAGARGGSEEALEWLAGRGCPMGDDGAPYLAAANNGDLATLECLKRLRCPWGPMEAVFTAAVVEPRCGEVEGHWSGEDGEESVSAFDDDHDNHGLGP